METALKTVTTAKTARILCSFSFDCTTEFIESADGTLRCRLDMDDNAINEQIKAQILSQVFGSEHGRVGSSLLVKIPCDIYNKV